MVVDRFGTTRTVEQIDAIWRYHASTRGWYGAHAYLLNTYGLAVTRDGWRLVQS